MKITIGSIASDDTPEDPRTPFAKVQEELDRSAWIGRGPHYELGGGGNDLIEEESEINPEHEWR